MEKKESIRELLKILREQESHRERKNGITTLVYYSLLITVVWSLISSTPAGDHINFLLVTKYYSNAFNIILLFFICFSSSGQSQFGERFKVGQKILWNPLLILFTLTGLSLSASTIVAATTEPVKSWEFFVWVIQSLNISINFIVLIIFLYASNNHQKKSKLPNPFIPTNDFFNSPHGRASLSIQFIILVALAAIFGKNVILSGNVIEVKIGAQLAALHILSFLLATHLNEKEESGKLSEIELALYLDEIDIDSIERKIKYEVIGIYASELIKNQFFELNKLAEQYLEQINSLKLEFEEIKCIDPKYKIEISGRIDKLIEKLSSLSDSQNKEINTTTEWIENYMKLQSLNGAGRVRSLIEEELIQYKARFENIDKLFSSFTTDMKEFFRA